MLIPTGFGLSPWEIAVILVVAILLFGKRLPEVMRSMGKGIVEFKKGLRGVEEDVETSIRKDEQERIAAANTKPEPLTTEQSPDSSQS